MGKYKDVFNDKSANLAAQDYIPAATGSWISRDIVGVDVGMTNFRAFIETGKMHFRGPEGEINIDFSKDDALMRTIEDVVQDARHDVRHSDEYKALKAADPATLEQRLAYEQVLSEAVFEGVERVDGLRQYRLDTNAVEANDMPEHYAQSSNEIISNNNLNSLSRDIEGHADMNTSYTTDFECEKMSALKGMIMQAIEDDLLPADDGSLKSAGSYFNAQGGMYMIGGFVAPDFEELIGKDEDVKVSRGWHAFVTSSKSGAVFEATAVNDDGSSGGNFYGADRMLIPLNFDGHLPQQSPYNYNFAMLAAGGRIGYVPMDPQNPGQMHPGAKLDDIKGYQVGSNDQLFAERMMAIQSGNLEGLGDLQKTIPQMSMDPYRIDLHYAAADFLNRRVSESVKTSLNAFDPDREGSMTFVENVMKEHVEDFDGLPESLKTAYTEYVAEGLDVPKELLLEIAQDIDVANMEYGNMKIQKVLQDLDGLRTQGPAEIEKQLVKAGMKPDEAKIFADDFQHKLHNGGEIMRLEAASDLSAGLTEIIRDAEMLKNGSSYDITKAAVSLSGDQNPQDTQAKQPDANIPAQPQQGIGM